MKDERYRISSDSIVAEYYSAKPDSYFGNARADFLARLRPPQHGAILEIGCGIGKTGEAALAKGLCDRYVGIEIDDRAATQARSVLTDVIHGNVESVDLPYPIESFDAILMSEVLEHLVNPWSTLSRLLTYVRPGGLVMASSPNVSHYRIILSLLQGKFNLSDRGVMDRTHLRWFTPATYTDMFEQAGVDVVEISPVEKVGYKASIIEAVTAGRLRHIVMKQICLIGYKRPA